MSQILLNTGRQKQIQTNRRRGTSCCVEIGTFLLLSVDQKPLLDIFSDPSLSSIKNPLLGVLTLLLTQASGTKVQMQCLATLHQSLSTKALEYKGTSRTTTENPQSHTLEGEFKTERLEFLQWA